MGIESKQEMKQKEENIFKKLSREKMETTKKPENREKNENVTETNELVLSNN